MRNLKTDLCLHWSVLSGSTVTVNYRGNTVVITSCRSKYTPAPDNVTSKDVMQHMKREWLIEKCFFYDLLLQLNRSAYIVCPCLERAGGIQKAYLST